MHPSNKKGGPLTILSTFQISMGVISLNLKYQFSILSVSFLDSSIHFTYQSKSSIISFWKYCSLTIFCPLSVPPESNRKPKVFSCFQGAQRETSGKKWVNSIKANVPSKQKCHLIYMKIPQTGFYMIRKLVRIGLTNPRI